MFDLEQILKNGESVSVEFKKATNKIPDSLFETICAFLNKRGGHILLGVADTAEVLGVDPIAADKIIKELVNLSNNPQKLYPSFLLEASKILYKDKILIHVFVPASSDVHRCNGKFFDRSDDGDFEVKNSEQIKSLYTRKSNYFSENTIYPFLRSQDFDPDVVSRVRKLIRIQRPDHPWIELADLEFFRISGLYRKDYVTGTEGYTLAALLLFGKDEVISSAVPHYKIDALLRRTDTDRYDDRENIRCNLIEAYDRLMAFVVKHLPDKFYMQQDQRISLRDKLFREVIANMIIHREYTNAYPSTFVIYNNCVETKNANRPHLFGQVKLDSFEPFPKNPHIAQIFTQIGRSEELGTGLRNIYKYSNLYSKSDTITFFEDEPFHVVVPLDVLSIESGTVNTESGTVNTESGTVNNGSGTVNTESGTVNKFIISENRRNEIVAYIRHNKYAKIEDLVNNLHLSRRTLMRDINYLKVHDMIERVGSDKNGYWEIKILSQHGE